MWGFCYCFFLSYIVFTICLFFCLGFLGLLLFFCFIGGLYDFHISKTFSELNLGFLVCFFVFGDGGLYDFLPFKTSPNSTCNSNVCVTYESRFIDVLIAVDLGLFQSLLDHDGFLFLHLLLLRHLLVNPCQTLLKPIKEWMNKWMKEWRND